MIVKHLQTMKKVKHMIYTDSQNRLALQKLEHFLQIQTQKSKFKNFKKLISNLTFPIEDVQNVRMYLDVLQEENVILLIQFN